MFKPSYFVPRSQEKEFYDLKNRWKNFFCIISWWESEEDNDTMMFNFNIEPLGDNCNHLKNYINWVSEAKTLEYKLNV
jgi:hypothetical protein